MKRKTAARSFLVAIAIAALVPSTVVASEEPPAPVGLDACAGDDAARLGFLIESLEGRQRYARNYTRGWLSFYTVGVGVSTYQAATEDDRGERAVDSLSAAKALFGIGRMVYGPPNAKYGADGIADTAPASAEACAADVAEAEERLRKNAHQAGRRYRWKSHLFNLGLHVVGAVAVGEGFDARKQAWVSAAIGTGVGEMVIWTFPWKQEADLAEYEERFPRSSVAASPRIAWAVVPTARGASFELRF
jgi:hypothetical protein